MIFRPFATPMDCAAKTLKKNTVAQGGAAVRYFRVPLELLGFW